jgi:hypothetical protein
MESFKRGFAFLKQSWQMASADRDLIKPSIFALIAGFIVTLLFILPMGLIGFVAGENPLGRALLFVLSAVMIFVHYVVGYVFSAMTIYLIYGYLSEGDGRLDKAWAVVQRELFHIVTLAAASTGVNLLKSFLRGRGRSGGRNALAGLIDTVWTEATYLVLPAMVIEDIGLADGLKRATHIIKNNLLLVGVSTVGVRVVTGLIGFLLGATGIALGLGVGLGLVGVFQGAVFAWVSGISLGVLIAGIFIIVATVVSSYTMTAYHTCLYLWARDVEKAQQQGQAGISIPAPAPLAEVLGQLG